MSDLYRKPSAPDAPRGTVVRQAEPPRDGVDLDELRAAYADDVRTQREATRRNADLGTRALGVAMIVIAAIILLTYRDEVAMTGTILASARGAMVLGLCALLGPWLCVFGNGGASTMREIPLWYRVGASLAALFGICAMATGAALPLLVALLGSTL